MNAFPPSTVRILCAGCILTALAAGSCFYWAVSSSRLAISNAHLGALSIDARSDQMGRLAFVPFQEGSFVKKGEVLFSFNDEEEKREEKILQETVSSLQEELTDCLADAEQAMQDYITAKSEAEMHLIAAEQANALLTIFQEQQAKTNECQKKLARVKNDLEKIKHQQQSKLFCAPFSGVIVKQEKRVGDLVQFGDLVYSMYDPGSIWVDAVILEKDLTKISIGQPATVRLKIDPEKKWEGTVSWVSPAALPAQGGVPIRISLSKKDETIMRPNLSAEVSIQIR